MKASGYNIMRDDRALLEEHEKSPASFSVHLYPAHWTLNSGPNFMYNNEVSSILEDIRAFRIPTDFIQLFDDAGVPYYNGCLIVEIRDYRPAKAKDPILEKPDVQRVVLRPNPETIWADICMMNAKTGSAWTDVEALEIEAKLLMSTSTPLCLDPDPHLTRVVNSILRVSTPNVPNSLKRKAAAMVDLEEDETEKAKRAKVMQYMNPQFNTARKPVHPSYKILKLMEQKRALSQQQASARPPSAIMSQVMLPANVAATNSNSAVQNSDNSTSTVQTVAPMMTARVSQTKCRQMPLRPNVLLHNLPAVTQPNAVDSRQAQGQSSQQPVNFNPPMPSSNYLNAPPTGKRQAQKLGTPAAPNLALPAQQTITQPQLQPQPQHLSQSQMPAQSQIQPQPHVQHPPPPQQPPSNMTQYLQMQQNGRVMAHQAAVAAAQRQVQSGRNTPANANNARISPAPPASTMSRSPMPPTAAAMVSGRNTPVAGSPQVARGSPLAANHPIAARNVGAQNVMQQQLHAQPQPMPAGTHPIMQRNPALLYQQQHQLRMQQLAYMQAQAQAQAQQAGLQQGHMSPAPQQHQAQQAGNVQVQQPSQEQTVAPQQFAPMNPQMLYMQQQQQYMVITEFFLHDT
ncbi:Spt20 family-domain-containing protein [Phellopilus nigrolimitatus]|nr:Spt20 family-domain-containing protein [Phellopilus nigrolimitatus]